MSGLDNFPEFVADKASHVIGNGMLGSAVILFEFINEDGNLCYSVLRPNGVSWSDTAELILNASDTFMGAIERGDLAPHECGPECDEDFDVEDGDDDDIEYK
jgi:hypothetical protein